MDNFKIDKNISKNGALLIYGALKSGDISKYENIIILSGVPRYMYEFACNVKLEDYSKIEDAIIASDDVFYMYHLAKDVKGVNIKKMEEAIISSGNACYMYLFARNFEEADVLRLEDEVIKAGDIEYMYYFLCHVKEANVLSLKYAIAEIIKRERKVRAAYLPIEQIMSTKVLSKSCNIVIWDNRQKSKVLKKNN